MILEFLSGFSVTIKHIFRKRVTLRYPEQKKQLPSFYRGRHRLRRYEDGLERCVGCALCASVCPSEAIYLEAAENTDENRVSPGERHAAEYRIHLLRCIFCGFCEEACPENAIVMGPNYELAQYDRQSCVIDKSVMLDPPEKGEGTYPTFDVGNG